MSWLESLLNSCLFCPPKEDASEHPTPRQRRLFTSLRDKEWHELLIKLNESFSELFTTAKQANKTLNENNQTIRLLVRNMDDVQNKLHQAIGEATSKGYL